MIKKKIIVIIDDDQSITPVLELIFQKTEYDARIFSNPVEALSFIKNSDEYIDLIITDLLMPEIDGITLVKHVKEESKFSQIPIIMQSGLAEESKIREAKEMGICDYLIKPYSRKEIMNLIERKFLLQ